MIPLVGLLLLPKLLILVFVFFLLALLLRGMSIYEKLTLYTLILMAAVFALSKI